MAHVGSQGLLPTTPTPASLAASPSGAVHIWHLPAPSTRARATPGLGSQPGSLSGYSRRDVWALLTSLLLCLRARRLCRVLLSAAVRPSICPSVHLSCPPVSMGHRPPPWPLGPLTGLCSVSLVLQWASVCPKSTFRSSALLGISKVPGRLGPVQPAPLHARPHSLASVTPGSILETVSSFDMGHDVVPGSPGPFSARVTFMRQIQDLAEATASSPRSLVHLLLALRRLLLRCELCPCPFPFPFLPSLCVPRAVISQPSSIPLLVCQCLGGTTWGLARQA